MGGGNTNHAFACRDFVDLCHYHSVPVYHLISASPLLPEIALNGTHLIERFRGRVSSMWFDGVDGIQLLNFYGNPDVTEEDPHPEFRFIGDPNKLVGRDKLYESASFPGWTDREILSDPIQRPSVVWSEPVTLKIGDPVERLAQQGLLRELLLQVRVTGLRDEESVQIRLNSQPVTVINRYPESRQGEIGSRQGSIRAGGDWFEAAVDVPPLRQGMNQVVVSPGPGCVGSAASRVEYVQLWVRYKQDV